MQTTGVIGSGTLRVLGEIHVFGQSGLNLGNSIAADVDLGGGTQVVRVGVISSFAFNRGLMFTGSLSNGSLKKSIGLAANGTIGSIDGISLFGNNTYTGDTILNSGTNVITGTNATQSLTIAGIAGPGFSRAILQGANGSLGSATDIRAYASGQFIIDNNATEGASGNNSPFIAAAQNNDRLADFSTVELRDGSFIYRGFTGSAASETFGNLNVAGGHNDILVAPNGGTAVLSATDLVMAPRSTLNIGTAGATGTAELGNQAKVLFSGAVPAADTTGIIRGVVTGSSTAGIATSTTPSNLVVYDAIDGFKAFSGYEVDFATAGANVALTSSTSSTTQTINALKTTGTMTTSIDSGETLTIDSGMMISASGTHTVSGGTLDFGTSPGMIFGNTTINSAMTGSDGLIHSTGSLTLSGDMSGLSGTLNANGSFTSQLNLNTGSFTGPIQVRNGTISFGANQVGPGLGAITLGVPENASDLFHATPTIGFTTAVTQIDRDIIVDNGGTNLDGILPSDSLVARIAPANYNADRHFTGDVTLHSDLAIFGGSAVGANTSSIFLDGDISGTGRILFRNGRVVFGEGSTWSNSGGMVIGALGNAAQVSFFGTGTGNGDISYSGSTTALPGLFRYNNDNSFGGGSISISGGLASGTTIEPTASSVINNQINLNNVLPNVSINTVAGVNAEWAGQINGAGSISKNGAGTWVISSDSNTHTGAISVNDGTLLVDGTVASSSNALTVGTNGILGGSGVINRNVSIAGSLAPGDSPGILTVNGNLTMDSGSTWYAELGGLAPGQFDQVLVSGNLDVLSNLVVSLVGGHTLSLNESYLIAAVEGELSGQFNGLSEGSVVGNFGGINLFVSYTGVSGNGIRLYTVPEPGSLMAVLVLAALPYARRRKSV